MTSSKPKPMYKTYCICGHSPSQHHGTDRMGHTRICDYIWISECGCKGFKRKGRG